MQQQTNKPSQKKNKSKITDKQQLIPRQQDRHGFRE